MTGPAARSRFEGAGFSCSPSPPTTTNRAPPQELRKIMAQKEAIERKLKAMEAEEAARAAAQAKAAAEVRPSVRWAGTLPCWSISPPAPAAPGSRAPPPPPAPPPPSPSSPTTQAAAASAAGGTPKAEPAGHVTPASAPPVARAQRETQVRREPPPTEQMDLTDPANHAVYNQAELYFNECMKITRELKKNSAHAVSLAGAPARGGVPGTVAAQRARRDSPA